jgi:hypothetical protein
MRIFRTAGPNLTGGDGAPATRVATSSLGGGVQRAEPVLSMIGRLFGRSSSETEAVVRSTSVDDGRVAAVRRRAARENPSAAIAHVPELRRFISVSEDVEPGDVLVLDRNIRGSSRPGDAPGDSAVIGVVSADPGRLKGRVATTVSGVVLCKVDATYGPVGPGDSLTVSPTRGHAMHSTIHGPGAILGRALEPLQSGRGLIKVLVTLR